MKTKEYIQKYELDVKFLNKTKSNEMSEDLKADFKAICDKMNINDNIRKFDSAVKEFRTKWEAISNKSKRGLSDGYWNFFYASVICKFREELCPTFTKRKAEKEAKRKEWEAKQAKEMNPDV